MFGTWQKLSDDEKHKNKVGIQKADVERYLDVVRMQKRIGERESEAVQVSTLVLVVNRLTLMH